MNLSPHFTLEEFTASETAARLGIINTPPDAIIDTLRYTANMLEVVRDDVLGGKPLHVNSAFRCLTLNRALKSRDTSDHVRGLAVDFVCPAFGTPLEICRALVESEVDFRQLIYEHTWVHIAFPAQGQLVERHERSLLTLMPGGTYAAGILEQRAA